MSGKHNTYQSKGFSPDEIIAKEKTLDFLTKRNASIARLLSYAETVYVYYYDGSHLTYSKLKTTAEYIIYILGHKCEWLLKTCKIKMYFKCL